MLKNYINDVNEIISNNKKHTFRYQNLKWPILKRSDLVLVNDMYVELGSPSSTSTSFTLFTESNHQIDDGKITLIGDNLQSLKGQSVSFSKIVLIETDSINIKEEYDKISKIINIRHELNFKGYMIRSMGSKSSEWIRISTEAIKKGFSVEVMGNEIITALKKLPYVNAVEVLFVINNETLSKELQPVGDKVIRVTNKMNTKYDDIQYNCSECELEDICEEIDGMKTMHGK